MTQRIDLRTLQPTPEQLRALIPRARTGIGDVTEVAAELIADVRSRGEQALREQAERLDRVTPSAIRVPVRHIDEAVAALDPELRHAVEETIRRVRAASAAQVPPERTTRLGDGAEVLQRWRPIGRVGVYVPGGKAVYPSSVVMNVVPAQVAGVRSLAMASPAQAAHGGRVHPTILAVAGLLGVREIYAMGGAGAIGAFAHGVPGLVEPVSLVTGPGNVFVAAAKRLVAGTVGIDSEAGPTDILVIADDTADARFVAADLVSQAEHDELAAAVLVTDHAPLADAVQRLLEEYSRVTKHAERVATALAGSQSAIVLVDDLEQASVFTNAFGPEHLEIQTRDPEVVAETIDNAGAIFLGPFSPVSLGDYAAGSNHILPTGGAARHSAALGAVTFLRPQQLVRYSRGGLEELAANILKLADAEDLPAHGEAVTIRFSGPGAH